MEYFCALCGKRLVVFADQEKFVDGLDPSDRMHEMCRIERDAVLPGAWHCERCDSPIIVRAWTIDLSARSPFTPELCWAAEYVCDLCGNRRDAFGRTSIGVAASLYFHMRCNVIRMDEKR